MLSIAQIIHSLARPFHEKSKNKLNFTELLDVVYRRSSCNCMIFTSNLIVNLIIIFLLNQTSFYKPAMRNKKDPELEPIFGGASRSNALADSHPEHIGRRTRILLVVCILFTELCERLTFYGIVANLVLYCRDYLKLEAPLPSSISLTFQGRLQLFFCLMNFFFYIRW